MVRYVVVFHTDAEEDIRASFLWGIEMWGVHRAQEWLRSIRTAIKTQLTNFPEACPIAPESAQVGMRVHQLLVHRYRILFVINAMTVIILHVRGSYALTAEISDIA